MSQPLCDLAEMLHQPNAPADETGALAIVRNLLQQYEPTLLMLVDAFGRPLALGASQPAIDVEQAKSLAAEASERLGADAIACWRSDDNAESTAFAVRAGDGQCGGLLCGLLGKVVSAGAIAQLREALEACTALALWAVHAEQTVKQLRVKAAHLKAQQETLADSYEKAVAAAIEEHERRLCEQQAYYARISAVMQTAGDAIITADEHGTVEMFNHTAERIFGYSAAEIVGKPLWILAPPELLTLEIVTQPLAWDCRYAFP